MTKTQSKSASTAQTDTENYRLVDKNEYIRLKRRAIKFEKKNNQYILLIPCDGDQDWYEMGDISALIYKYRICMPMGKPVSLMDDGDSFYLQYQYGRVRTRGTEAVRKRIQKAGQYKDEQEKDGCIIFQLRSAYSQSEIARIKEDEMSRQAAINSIIKVDFADPALFQKLTEVATRLHRICLNRMDKISRELNGKVMVGLIDAILRRYYEISYGTGEGDGRLPPERVKALWQEMRTSSRSLLVELQIVAGLKIWDKTICANIGKDVDEIIKMIERNLRRK